VVSEIILEDRQESPRGKGDDLSSLSLSSEQSAKKDQEDEFEALINNSLKEVRPVATKSSVVSTVKEGGEANKVTPKKNDISDLSSMLSSKSEAKFLSPLRKKSFMDKDTIFQIGQRLRAESIDTRVQSRDSVKKRDPDNSEFMNFLNIDKEVQDLQSRRKDSVILGIKNGENSIMVDDEESSEHEKEQPMEEKNEPHQSIRSASFRVDVRSRKSSEDAL
jgi:hypothetical protein